MTSDDVWDLVYSFEGNKPIRCKWLYKTMRDTNGQDERYRARLVSKRFSPKMKLTIEKIFSPYPQKILLELVMAIVAHFDSKLH